MRKLNRLLLYVMVALCTNLAIYNTASASDNDIELPELTPGGSSLMSANREKALGQSWLRQFRAAVPLEDDPLIFEYLEQLLMRLAAHSQLDDRSLDLVVVDNNTINAFAVPGGVVGINTGLIINAGSEGELASVLGHELAHLSQHHFARRVEAAKSANLASLGGLLAGIILAATAGGDAATAAIATSQAAAIDSQLRYSRTHEREADRLGMKTMIHAGYSPTEAAAMFRRMQTARRLYGNAPPEFLLTHPITKSRIADAENRSRQYLNNRIGSDRLKSDSLDFQLIRSRILVENYEYDVDAISEYTRQLEAVLEDKKTKQLTAKQTLSNDEIIARYALALSLNRAGNWKKARAIFDPVMQEAPGRLIYSLLDISIDETAGNNDSALRRLRDLYALTPNNYSIGMALANTAIKNKHYTTAQRVLNELTEARPKQADIWYLLAEAHGLVGDIAALHWARAEFFGLRNNFDSAQFHLTQALRLSRNNIKLEAKVKQRLRQVAAIQHQTRGNSSP